jgi:nicotinamide-nucleotide adenylyltransferase
VRGLFVGRFQPFHRGHLALVRQALERTPRRRLLVAIGSAEQSYTWENPFTGGERFEMVARALEEARLERVDIVPVADISRHALWVRYLEGLLPPFDRIYSHNPLTVHLFERAGYAVASPPLVDRAHLEGAQIRRRLALGRPVRALVPPAVDRFLREVKASARLRLLSPARPARRSDRRT